MSRVLALVAVLLAVFVAGCGDDGPSPPTSTVAASRDLDWQANEGLEADAKGTEGISACRLLSQRDVVGTLAGEGIRDLPRLRRERNDSLDLSQCRYGRGPVNVRIVIDAAAQAGRRFFEQQHEFTQKFVRIPRLRPQLVHHVGDDRAWANAGAFWTPSYDQLVAHKDGRIVRTTVSVPHTPDATRKAAAGAVARLMFRRLARADG